MTPRILLIVFISIAGYAVTEAATDPTGEPVYLGWAGNSKIAIGIKIDDEENSIYQYEYRITDLVTDKIIYEKSFKLGYAAFANGYADETIADETKEFKKRVAENRIVPAVNLKVYNNPTDIALPPDHYTIRFNVEREGGAITSYAIESIYGSKKKTITKVDVLTRSAQDVNYLFAVASPDKKRLSIVVLEREYGSTAALRAYVIGSSLTTGFK